jgi:hypothetical protein
MVDRRLSLIRVPGHRVAIEALATATPARRRAFEISSSNTPRESLAEVERRRTRTGLYGSGLLEVKTAQRSEAECDVNLLQKN